MKNPTKVWQFNHFHKKNSNREKKESNFYEQKKKFLKLFIFFWQHVLPEKFQSNTFKTKQQIQKCKHIVTRKTHVYIWIICP